MAVSAPGGAAGIGGKRFIRFPPSSNNILFEADFTSLALGGMSAANFLTATGLTFERSSNSTVQTGTATVVTGLGSNTACIGSRDGTTATKGLVMEMGTPFSDNGAVSLDPRKQTGGSWTGASGSRADATGIDGSANVCSEWTIASGGYSNYIGNAVTTTSLSLQCWVYGSSPNAVINNGSVNTGVAYTDGSGNVWRKVVLNNPTNITRYGAPVDGRNYAGVGGMAAGAHTNRVDLCSILQNPFSIEGPGDGADRQADVLSIAAGQTWLLDSGQVNVELKFIPKHAFATIPRCLTGSANNRGQVAAYRIWYKDANNYASINPTTGIITVKNGGTTFSSASGITWSQNDVVELFVGAGSGSAPTACYRLNGGAKVALGGATAIGAITITGRVDLANNSAGATDKENLTCWLQTLRAYRANGMPSWAA